MTMNLAILLGLPIFYFTTDERLLTLSSIFLTIKGGPIAQWLEQSAHNRKVPGSIPGGPTIYSHLPDQRREP